jgi:predicted RecB family nuclease
MDARQILARNIRGLMANHPELDNARKLAARCSSPTRKIGHNTIERMISPDKSEVQPRLDTIVAVAHAFRLTADQLLSAALDPEKPNDSVPPASIIDLARRLWSNREVLLGVLGPDAVSDQEMEALGWSSKKPAGSESQKLHEDSPGYATPPRQTKMRL